MKDTRKVLQDIAFEKAKLSNKNWKKKEVKGTVSILIASYQTATS